MATILKVKQPFRFRGFDVPGAYVAIDWVSFDRCEQKAEIILGLYRIEEDAAPAVSKENRLDAIRLVFQNGRQVTEEIDGETVTRTVDEYSDLIADHPEIFAGIVAGVYELAATLKSEIFALEEI